MLCLVLAVALACGQPSICTGDDKGRTVRWREGASCEHEIVVSLRRPKAVRRIRRHWCWLLATQSPPLKTIGTGDVLP